MDKNKPLLSQQKLLLWIPLLISTMVLGAYVWNFIQQPLSDDAGKWGTFGDYFGGLLNPVIAACTLIVAVGVWHDQKTELEATQNALKDQARTAKQQRAEQRFFDLMNFYHQTLDGFQIEQASGKQALTQWLLKQDGHLKGLTGLMKMRGNQNPSPSRIKAHNENWQDGLRSAWQQPEIAQQLSHYFRLLHRILTDAQELLTEDHFRFVRLFRAQLSQTELLLIGLNLWASPEGQKMQSIASLYGLLKHLPEGDFRTILERQLPAEVFGRTFAEIKMMQSSDNKPC